MATQAKEATAKAGTSSASHDSLLRSNAPRIRTADAVIAKHEQIQDGLERQAITAKQAEQMNQTLKGILSVERLGIQFLSMILKFGRKAPVPRSPILRSLLNLPENVSPSDGEQVRAMLPEK